MDLFINESLEEQDKKKPKLMSVLQQGFDDIEAGRITTDEHKKILDERLANHQTNPNFGKSWEQVKADLQCKANEL